EEAPIAGFLREALRILKPGGEIDITNENWFLDKKSSDRLKDAGFKVEYAGKFPDRFRGSYPLVGPYVDLYTRDKTPILYRGRKPLGVAAVTDGAMMNGVGIDSSNAPGGIDLNTNKLDLNVQNSGQGIAFHIDPAMLKQLQNA